MSGGDHEPGNPGQPDETIELTDAVADVTDQTDDDAAEDVADDGAADTLTAVAEPAVIDLRDGVDTIAAHQADQARRAQAARPRP